MASVDPEDQAAALPYRVYGLEGVTKTQDQAIERLHDKTSRHSEALAAQAVTLARHDELIGKSTENLVEVKTDVAGLAVAVVALGERFATSTNKVAWTFVGFALTLASSAIAVIIFGAPPGQ
jgi:hypothetical protein